MSIQIINLSLFAGDSVIKRKSLSSYFLNETAGTGKGENTSRYQYNVETYNNYGIYLKRSTHLNKGFDFTVNVSGMCFKKNKRYSNPSHQDIFNALACCKHDYPQEYDKVKNAISAIYDCEEISISNINA